MSRLSGCILPIALVGTVCFGQTRPAQQIEAALHSRLESAEGMTTQGMVEAYDEAAKAYRAEISRVFEKLIKGLPKRQAHAVAMAHGAWLKYFEAERLCVSYVYDADGTMHRVIGMSYLTDLLRNRLAILCQMFLGSNDLDAKTEEVPPAEFWCRHPSSHERIRSLPSDPLGPSAFEQSATSMPKPPTRVRRP